MYEHHELIEIIDNDYKDMILELLFSEIEKHDPQFIQELSSTIRGLKDYNNFLTESEYEGLVANLENQDGTTGPKFNPDIAEAAVRNYGGILDQLPYYNKWALLYTINYEMAIHTNFITESASKLEMNQVMVAYNLAIDKLVHNGKSKWVRSNLT